MSAVFDSLKSRIFGKGPSTVTAKNRLQMVLVQDRSGMSSQEMEMFRKDLLDVIRKYFVIESKSLEVNWERNDEETALVINTPVTGRLKAASKRAAGGRR